jgi:hypothetical protein
MSEPTANELIAIITHYREVSSRSWADVTRAEKALFEAGLANPDAPVSFAEYAVCRGVALAADEQVAKAEAKLAALLPDATQAIMEVDKAQAEIDALEAQLVASRTPEQIELQARIESAQATQAILVKIAKECVLAAGKSPLGGFSVSNNTTVTATDLGKLPEGMVTTTTTTTIDAKKAIALLKDAPEVAKEAGLEVVIEPKSVSFTPSNLPSRKGKK